MEPGRPSFLSIARDTLLVGISLAAVNAFTSRGDPGWLMLNPTPWLLLPLLMGCKYGLGPGAVAGALAAVGMLVAQWKLMGNGISLNTVAQAHPFYFSGLVLVGFISGAFRSAFEGRQAAAMQELRAANDSVKMLKAEVEIVREGRSQLQQQLLLYNANLAGLDEDLKKLFSTTQQGDMLQDILHLMHRHTGLISAAFYQHKGSGQLLRLAALHETPALAAQLHVNDVPLAAKALTEATLVSIPAPVSGATEQPFLAALPFNWNGMDGVLLVQNMPLRTFDWQHLAQLELILKWAFSLDTLRNQRRASGDPSAFVAVEDFLFMLNESLSAEQKLQLPSVICRADFLDAKQAQDPSLIRRLLSALPVTAIPTRLPRSGSIIALLPFGGESDAKKLGNELTALGLKLRTSAYSVIHPSEGPATAANFWQLVSQE
jgi:hypothetical protein